MNAAKLNDGHIAPKRLAEMVEPLCYYLDAALSKLLGTAASKGEVALTIHGQRYCSIGAALNLPNLTVPIWAKLKLR